MFPRQLPSKWSQAWQRLEVQVSDFTETRQYKRFFEGSNGGDESLSQNWRLEEQINSVFLVKVTAFQKVAKLVPGPGPGGVKKTNELGNRFPRFSCNPEWSQVIPRIHWGMINQHRTSQKTLENYWQRFFQWIQWRRSISISKLTTRRRNVLQGHRIPENDKIGPWWRHWTLLHDEFESGLLINPSKWGCLSKRRVNNGVTEDGDVKLQHVSRTKTHSKIVGLGQVAKAILDVPRATRARTTRQNHTTIWQESPTTYGSMEKPELSSLIQILGAGIHIRKPGGGSEKAIPDVGTKP